MAVWAFAFAVTLAVELPLYAWAGRLLAWGPARRTLTFALLANVATHPLLWWLSPSTPDALLAAECAIVVAEAAILALALRTRIHQALLAAVLANATSFLVGLVWWASI